MEIFDLQILQNAEIFLCSENSSFCEHKKVCVFNEKEQEILQSKLYPWEDYVVVGFLMIVGSTAIFLNGFVVFMFIRRKHPFKSCDYFVLNLALSDILMPISFPLSIYSSLHHKMAIGNNLCEAYGFVGFFRGVVSICTLTAISCARYISVCCSEKEKVMRHSKISLVIIYGYAAMWATLPLIGVGAYGPEPYGTSCTLKWDGHPIFVAFFLILCILVPVVIMNLSYGGIILYIRHTRLLSQHIIRSSTTVKKREKYLMKMTFVMCFGFIGLWAPYAVIGLVSAFGKKSDIPVRLSLVTVLLAKLSTILNPVVYFMLNRHYRPLLRKFSKKLTRTLQNRMITPYVRRVKH